MDLPDELLFQLAVRMDNETLENLYMEVPAYRAGLKRIITQPQWQFWYVRSEWLVGRELQARPNADWRAIYRNLVDAQELGIRKHIAGLNDLDSLLVLIEVYGPITLDQNRLWTLTSNADVLAWLLSTGTLTVNEAFAVEALEGQLSYGQSNTQLISRLIDICESVSTPTPVDWLEIALRADDHPAIDLLLSRYGSNVGMELLHTLPQAKIREYELTSGKSAYKVLFSPRTLVQRILRFIIVHKPGARELLAWLIGLRDPIAIDAARDILGLTSYPFDTMFAIRPVRALLLTLLYPTMKLDEALELLYRDAYIPREIEQARVLIRTYLA